jgi:hypothetical protein
MLSLRLDQTAAFDALKELRLLREQEETPRADQDLLATAEASYLTFGVQRNSLNQRLKQAMVEVLGPGWIRSSHERWANNGWLLLYPQRSDGGMSFRLEKYPDYMDLLESDDDHKFLSQAFLSSPPPPARPSGLDQHLQGPVAG